MSAGEVRALTGAEEILKGRGGDRRESLDEKKLPETEKPPEDEAYIVEKEPDQKETAQRAYKRGSKMAKSGSVPAVLVVLPVE